ncbi:hypothetical protein ADUPG1_006542 [Aduncisulcus paluster]|uniref:Uncharacterized protein n=1 Tax=Aduncisulcus paluster TaxID=2918883 RepID=A0ABQ5KIL8_9EUKA|nr:hypothetical protein ADUPG1_006542 [Aduncisulcus paluster]
MEQQQQQMELIFQDIGDFPMEFVPADTEQFNVRYDFEQREIPLEGFEIEPMVPDPADIELRMKIEESHPRIVVVANPFFYYRQSFDIFSELSHKFPDLVSVAPITTNAPPTKGCVEGEEFFHLTRPEFAAEELLFCEDATAYSYGLSSKVVEDRDPEKYLFVMFADVSSLVALKDKLPADTLFVALTMDEREGDEVLRKWFGDDSEEFIRRSASHHAILEDTETDFMILPISETDSETNVKNFVDLL